MDNDAIAGKETSIPPETMTIWAPMAKRAGTNERTAQIHQIIPCKELTASELYKQAQQDNRAQYIGLRTLGKSFQFHMAAPSRSPVINITQMLFRC